MKIKIRTPFTLLVISTLAVILLLTACHQEEDAEKFTPGDVIVGIKPDVSIDGVFDLMNEEGVFINEMSGFFAYSLLPTDSLAFINNQLISKSYLNKGGWNNQTGDIVGNRIRLIIYFFEMDQASQTDWLETVEKCKLVDMQLEKYVLIKVKPGTEKQWLKYFTRHPYVQWAELNKIGEIRIGN